MTRSAILRTLPLGFPWPTVDPFLFCVHHDDHYPKANGKFGPAASLAGRDIGQDFSRQDGWSMYHGHQVPGFPAHPHRGFETVTLVRKGLIDHSDSLGAAARFGRGDVQWLTAGKGINHSEMFPLLSETQDNPVELFQIWLNLPAVSKMAEPHFTMFWAPEIPLLPTSPEEAGVEVRIVAGQPAGQHLTLPSPPPNSWAARSEADVAIWTIRLEPGASWTLPPAQGAQTKRMLYAFAGLPVSIEGQTLSQAAALELDAQRPVSLTNLSANVAEFLMLQGRPIAEPVAQYGPFVMNSQAEIRQAMLDYQQGLFGEWTWPDSGPVHGSEDRRFARYPDGTVIEPKR